MKNKLDIKTIWTIGHSTLTLKELVERLHSFQIKMLVDIRSFPHSRHNPQFNTESLEITMPENNIQYVHLKELGGRRKPNPDSKNTSWHHIAFRSYADYMETEEFKNAIKVLEQIGLKNRTAYMCSEAVWWRCHRRMVSDYLKVHGWKVMHIMELNKAEEHPFNTPAHVVKGELSYWPEDLFNQNDK